MPRYAPIGQKKQYAARLRRGENKAQKIETRIAIKQMAQRRQANVNSKVNRSRVDYKTYKNRIGTQLRTNLDRTTYRDFWWENKRGLAGIGDIGVVNPLIVRLTSQRGYKDWARSGKSVEGFFRDWKSKNVDGGPSTAPRKNIDLGERKISREKSAYRK